MAPVREIYRVKWNNFTGVLRSNLRGYLQNEKFADVTLACEGQRIRCHRMILASASEYFESLLGSNEFPDAATANTIIYLKDVKFWELKILIEYLYNGEITISEEKLRRVSAIAESLRIKGFAGEEGVIDEDIAKDLGLKNVRTRPAPTPASQPPVASQTQPLQPQRQPQAQTEVPLKRKAVVTSPPRLIKIQKSDGGALVSGRSQTQGNSNGVWNKAKLPRSDVISERLQQSQNQLMEQLKATAGEQQRIKMEEDRPDQEMVDDDENELEIAEVETSVEENAGTSESEDEEDDAGGKEMSQVEVSSVAGGGGQQRKGVYKYSQEIRDNVLSSLQSGVSLRQCSDTFGIPRKTIAKWKQREAEDINNVNPYEILPVVTTHSGGDDDALNRTYSGPPPAKRRAAGVSFETGDRAERLEAAMKLAISGTTVRQAAVTYEIPRTTLCAYMKRRGVQTASGVKRPNQHTASTGQTPGSLNTSVDDFPLFGLSDLIEDVDGDGEFGEGDEDELY